MKNGKDEKRLTACGGIQPEVCDGTVELCGGVQPEVCGEMLEDCGGLPTAEDMGLVGAPRGVTEPMIEHPSDIVEMVFVLDKSGSMAGKESDTVGGFNSLIEEQRAFPGRALVSTVLFSTGMEILHDRIPIDEVKPLTESEYRVGGCTALLDAVGKTVEHIVRIRKYLRIEDIPARTVFVITTDGEENASRDYTAGQIKRLIEKYEGRGWEFMFLGAGIDAFASAERIGIKRKNTANYSVDDETDVMYGAVCDAVTSFRRHGSISESWSDGLTGGKRK